MCANVTPSAPETTDSKPDIRYKQYEGEQDIELVKQLVDPELSEPYSIFTYRLFLSPWPNLCHFCHVDKTPVGVVVCKIDERPNGVRRGYLGMIVVLKEYRKLGIGSDLARRAIESMVAEDVGEVALECEAHNQAALALYQRLGFLKEKRLRRYYLTGSDAIRLKLRLKPQPLPVDTEEQPAGEEPLCQERQCGGGGCCGPEEQGPGCCGPEEQGPGCCGPEEQGPGCCGPEEQGPCCSQE